MVPDTYADLFWSYTAVWVVLAVYIGTLGFRVATLERMIGRIDKSRSGDESTTVCNSKR
jgi:CcmD family protein